MANVTRELSLDAGVDVVYGKVTAWCSRAGVEVAESNMGEGAFTVKGKKQYKMPIMFRWRLALALFLAGFLVSWWLNLRVGNPLVLVLMLVPPAAYVAYFLFVELLRDALYDFEGQSADGGTTLSIGLSHDVNDALTDLQDLFADLGAEADWK